MRRQNPLLTSLHGDILPRSVLPLPPGEGWGEGCHAALPGFPSSNPLREGGDWSSWPLVSPSTSRRRCRRREIFGDRDFDHTGTIQRQRLLHGRRDVLRSLDIKSSRAV